MSIQGVSSFLIKADQVCDFVPVVSTVNNLVDLFIKIVILPQMDPEDIEVDRYYTHLDKKTFTRCTLLLVPILGQILVYLGDLLCDNKTFALELVKINGLHLQELSKRLRNDRDVVFAAVKQNPDAIKYAGEKFDDDVKVMCAFDEGNGKSPIPDREKVLEAVEKVPMAIEGFSEFWGDKEVMLVAVKSDGNLFMYASDELKDDDEVFLAAVKTNPRALLLASKRIQDSEGLVLEALRRTYKLSSAWVLEFATKRVRSDKVAMLEAILIDPKAFFYIDKVLEKDPDILQAYRASLARKSSELQSQPASL